MSETKTLDQPITSVKLDGQSGASTGHVTLTDVAGSVKAETNNGDIEVHRA